MKKLLFILSLVFVTSFSFAQEYKFGIKGGVNFSHQGSDSETLSGFHAGGILDVGFKNFSIQPGLLFSTKGDKARVLFDAYGGGGTSLPKVYSTSKYNFIELPVNVLYKFYVGQNVKVFVGGGPYVGYALSGSWLVDGQKLGYIDFSDDRNPGRFDYGVGFTGGFELKKAVVVNAGYSLSTNIFPNSVYFSNHVISFL
jgi:hypothetical protein